MIVFPTVLAKSYPLILQEGSTECGYLPADAKQAAALTTGKGNPVAGISVPFDETQDFAAC